MLILRQKINQQLLVYCLFGVVLLSVFCCLRFENKKEALNCHYYDSDLSKKDIPLLFLSSEHFAVFLVSVNRQQTDIRMSSFVAFAVLFLL